MSQFEFAQTDHEWQRLRNERPGWTYGSTEPCRCDARLKSMRIWHAPSDGHIALKMCVECNSQWVHHGEG